MKKSLFFKKGNILHKILLENICFIQANGDYSLTTGEDFKFISSMGISELADLLEADGFIQIHRSYIVNINKIDSIDLISHKIMVYGIEIPLSKGRKKYLLDTIEIVK